MFNMLIKKKILLKIKEGGGVKSTFMAKKSPIGTGLKKVYKLKHYIPIKNESINL